MSMDRVRGAVASGALALSLLLAGAVRAEESSAMQDVVNVLKRNGKINDAEERTVLTKYAAETKTALPSFLNGLDVSGDFLVRNEDFFMDRNAAGVDANDRIRFQYRARVLVTKRFSDRVKVGVRLASGTIAGDRRSTNSSFGDAANDEFAPDGIFFDRAFVEIGLPGPKALQSAVTVGRVANPFLSTVGPDFLVFDSDLNLEGGFLTSSFRPSETTRIFVTGGAFVIDEVQNGKDPKLVAGQLGFETSLTQKLRVGLRGSAYSFRTLNDAFLATSMGFGNLSSAFPNGQGSIGETYGFLRYEWSPRFPVLIFAQGVKNFSAQNATIMGFDVDKEEYAYGLGFIVGNPNTSVALTFGYFAQQANATPAQFPDGATFDTLANREGYLVAAARNLNPATQFRLSFADSREIKDTGRAMGPFAPSFPGSDRSRIVADIQFNF